MLIEFYKDGNVNPYLKYAEQSIANPSMMYFRNTAT